MNPFLESIHMKSITTYYLNKNFDFRTPLCTTCPDVECVFTKGNFNIPENITFCARFETF